MGSPSTSATFQVIIEVYLYITLAPSMEPGQAVNDFIWPGEPGFNGFPKPLSADCLEYSIYAINAAHHSLEQVRNRLNEVQSYCNKLLKDHMKGYIWQRESFKLCLTHRNDYLALKGRTEFGDSIADEFVIVYLLVETSKHFSDVWFRCTDSDGEFLLVEAASALPNWLNPELAGNRVWINQGKLLIIPRSQALNTKNLDRVVTLDQALEFIANNSEALYHSMTIQNQAFERIQGFPKKIKEHFHTSLITIPRKMAFILSQLPASVSPTAEAFYMRDPIALRPLQAAATGQLQFPPLDLVTMSVKFTRVSFAQLKSQRFSAPSAWQSRFTDELDEEGKARLELGMKVTCGMDMLLADPQKQTDKTVRIIHLLLSDLEEEKDLLPSDEEVSQWPSTDDDEGWLNVSFEDFEQELAGQEPKGSGFGDKGAQQNLRRIVERFEEFLRDEDAGVEGAQIEDEMDEDNDPSEDDDTEDDIDFESIRQKVSELGTQQEMSRDELANAFKCLMDLPPPAAHASSEILNHQSARGSHAANQAEAGPHRDDDAEKMMNEIEGELRARGVMDTNSWDASTESEAQHQLLENLLESFKSQSGTAGPAGNLMGAMGFRLPRDETDL